ncbi:succinate--CoA ligase subunit beta [Candidatus Saccharibacteria bacterium]|nr:succinate--CoA ligase subunit beta [Candidatus Saccharibacteria bacterium]
MKLLEYQAKNLLAMQGVSLPVSQLLESPVAPLELPLPVVLKMQVPVGGRGKAGGIRVATTLAEAAQLGQELFTREISGYGTEGLLAEALLDIKKEYYLSLMVDTAEATIVLLAHKQGGVDIEQAATAEEPLRRFVLEAAPDSALSDELLAYFDLPAGAADQLQRLLGQLYDAFVSEDMLLLEINPLVLTKQNQLVCADAKIELDDDAGYRHSQHWPRPPQSSQFVSLPVDGGGGPVWGSMANGAGLAMATVDAITAAGARPANFLDIGGGTSSDKMLAAFQQISSLPQVSAIIVNIFGGITRCDDVARAILSARREVAGLPPLFIRLTGTNEEAGRALLAEAGIPLYTSLQECIEGALHV